jgi:hypothetical protein
MADQQKAFLQGFLDFGAGILTAAVGDAAANAIRGHINDLAGEKAKELFVDVGDRAKTLAEVSKLILSNDEKKRVAGNKIRAWIVEGWEKHEEGELTSLLKKIPDNNKAAVFQMLGSLDTYDEFTKTIRGFLFHDNALQIALKMVKQAESTGDIIVSDDIRELWTATSTTVNNLAGAARPGIRNLTETLRRIR